MQAFLIGLLFLLMAAILGGIGILVFPLLLLLAFVLRLILAFALIIFAVWFLGKFIIFIWKKTLK